MAKKLVKEKIAKLSDTPASDMMLYDELYAYHNNTYIPTMGRVESAMGIAYAVDSTPELAHIPFTDGHKFLFPLMKWAIGTTMDF